MSYVILREKESKMTVAYRVKLKGYEYDISRNFILSKEGGEKLISLLDMGCDVQEVFIEGYTYFTALEKQTGVFVRSADTSPELQGEIMRVLTYDLFGTNNIVFNKGYLSVCTRVITCGLTSFTFKETITDFGDISKTINRDLSSSTIEVNSVEIVGKLIVLAVTEISSGSTISYNLALDLRIKSVKIFKLYERDCGTYLALGKMGGVSCLFNMNTCSILRSLVSLGETEDILRLLISDIGRIYIVYSSILSTMRLVLLDNGDEVLLVKDKVVPCEVRGYISNLVDRGVIINGQTITIASKLDYSEIINEYKQGRLKN